VPLADGCLVDVAGEDELGAGIHERGEHAAAFRYGLLARAPRRPEQVVVEDDDPERGRRRFAEELRGAG
jgi:hypothetical protein